MGYEFEINTVLKVSNSHRIEKKMMMKKAFVFRNDGWTVEIEQLFHHHWMPLALP